MPHGLPKALHTAVKSANRRVKRPRLRPVRAKGWLFCALYSLKRVLAGNPVCFGLFGFFRCGSKPREGKYFGPNPLVFA